MTPMSSYTLSLSYEFSRSLDLMSKLVKRAWKASEESMIVDNNPHSWETYGYCVMVSQCVLMNAAIANISGGIGVSLPKQK